MISIHSNKVKSNNKKESKKPNNLIKNLMIRFLILNYNFNKKYQYNSICIIKLQKILKIYKDNFKKLIIKFQLNKIKTKFKKSVKKFNNLKRKMYIFKIN